MPTVKLTPIYVTGCINGDANVVSPNNFINCDSESTTYAYLYNGDYFGFNFSYASIPEDNVIDSIKISFRMAPSSASGQYGLFRRTTNPVAYTQYFKFTSTTTSSTLYSRTLAVSLYSQIKKTMFVIAKSSSNKPAKLLSSDHFYGADLTITYHPNEKIYYKSSGTWQAASKAYKKTNGVWVEQSDLTAVFDSDTNYVKGN